MGQMKPGTEADGVGEDCYGGRKEGEELGHGREWGDGGGFRYEYFTSRGVEKTRWLRR